MTDLPYLPGGCAWEIAPLSRGYEVQLGKMLQPQPASNADHLVHYLKAGIVHWDGSQGDDLPEMWCAASEVETYRVRAGDLLVCEGGDAGRCAMLDAEPERPVIIQNALHRVRARPGHCGRFLYYVLAASHASGWLDVLCSRATIGHLTREKLSTLVIPAPPLSEQRAIAAFLDRKTRRIDGLIERNHALISTLADRRWSVIYEQISGQHLQGPRKPAQLPWLDSVPHQWEIAPLYSRYSIQLGKMLDGARISGDRLAPYLRNVNVQWDRLELDDLLDMDFNGNDRLKYALEPGDLLVCEGGEVGRAAMWRGELTECYYQKALHRLRPIRFGEQPRYLLYVLWAAAAMGVFVGGSNANTIDHLTAEKLRVHRFPFPPSEEQRSIVDRLDRALNAVARSERLIQQQITLLQERRESLIASTLAGRINVQKDGCERPHPLLSR